MRRSFEHASVRLLTSGEIDLVLDFRTPLGRARRQTYRFADRGRYADFYFAIGAPMHPGERRVNKRGHAVARATAHASRA